MVQARPGHRFRGCTNSIDDAFQACEHAKRRAGRHGAHPLRTTRDHHPPLPARGAFVSTAPWK
jgi:hypothetical protein